MCKKIVTVAAVVLAVCGLALADNVIDIDQIGTPASATVSQEGSNQSIIIDQIGVSADPSTGLVNNVWAKQWKYGPYKIDVYQNAGTYNYAWLYQSLGGQQEIKAVQNAGTGYNYLMANQANWKGNNIDIKQTAGTTNWAELTDGYYMTDIVIKQEAATYNKAYVYQNINNSSMYLYGADSSGNIDNTKPATQISTDGSNDLKVEQYNNDSIGLYQSGFGNNWAEIYQKNGNNTLGIYQTNTDGYNSVIATQNGNSSATVIQSTTSGAGTITVDQG